MEVRYLGHAGFAIDAGGQRLLVDPWFGPAFLNSWWPFPRNDHLLHEVLDSPYDALYVSHLHEDHFDRRFLDLLPKATPVLCPSYRSRAMLRRWQELGFTDITLVDHEQTIDFATGVKVTVLHDTSHREDSALLIEDGAFRFLDLNDCLVKMSELPARIDLLTRQYSGATWYPNCYEYPVEVMAEKVLTMRANLLDTLVTTCETAGARWYIPSAGPPCFRDPALERFTDRPSTIFPVWEDIADAFTRACPQIGVLRARPGDRILIADDAVPVLTGSAEPPATAVGVDEPFARWPRDYSQEPVTTEELRAHFARRVRTCQELVADHRKVFTLSTESSSWLVTLGPYPELDIAESEPSPGPEIDVREPDVEYSLSMSDWVLRAVIDSNDWEDALLSLRITLARDPDEFDVRFLGLLRYGHSPAMVRQLIADIRGSRETIDRDGLRMQRYCPHSGEDLTHAIICDGVIECPRHHWKWDAGSGVCIEGGTIPLRVTTLDHPAFDAAVDD